MENEEARIKTPDTEVFNRMNPAQTCRSTLAVALCAAATLSLSAAAPQKAGGTTAWIAIGGKDVEGRGWSDTELPFDRIPKRFAKDLPHVWGNGVSSTGEFFEFESDTTTVSVRTEFAGRGFGERNFNSCAFAGTDLYVFDAKRGDWRWAAAAGHAVRWGKNVEYRLVGNLSRQARRFRLYLPLRNRIASLSLGVDAASRTKLVPPRKGRPVVYYGTSIIHGAYNIRPDVARIDEEKTRLFAELAKKVAARHANFRYLPGQGLYGSDEVSMDGVHPNDEAFAHMAAALAPVISGLLPPAGSVKSEGGGF